MSASRGQCASPTDRFGSLGKPCRPFENDDQETNSPMKFTTTAIHVGQDPDPSTGSTVPPIHLTTTYTQESPAKHKGYEYSRSANPTRDNLEAVLAALEGGQACAAFASGLAATNAVFHTLRPGDNVLAFGDVYGGTFRLLERVFKHWGLEARFTDDPDPESFKKLIDKHTKLLWIETPTNPLLRVLDIKALADVAHNSGAKMAVDNTFATPALQQPLALGADYVIHSTTKYIGGHSDVIGGAVIVKNAADLEPISFYQNAAGGIPGPFDVYLAHRGLKTLSIRMERHCRNAARLAEHLTGHAKLEHVIYPGLPNHPDHALTRKQMCAPGGMVSIVVKGGRDGAYRFCERTKLFSLAESLGGVESLVCHPAAMTHASIPREIREARGVTDGLVRLSVGIEDADDLIADLEQALS
ncbi:MAG: cystathionine gamma-synthase [Planctomycetes bacterium]|nr:cystathionine gamma-synthase [Planctomycetota bacterium]